MDGKRAVVTTYPAGVWRNAHQNVSQRYQRRYDVWNADVDDFYEDMAATVAALQQIVGEAIRDGVTVRAQGAGWSLSHAAVTDGRLVNTAPLSHMHFLRAGDVADAGDTRHLVYVQCGTSVGTVNRILADHDPRLALKTSGASNGQTIVGAISTGTHGSAFAFGSMPEFVTGIHLVTGPAGHVFLERASDRAIDPSFAQRLGAELIADDDLFDAALVSFGSFGIIAGMVISTEPLSLLECSRYRLPLDDALRATMNDLSLRRIRTPYPDEEPHHFEVVVNPHDLAGGAYVTTMYKRPWHPTPQHNPWTERGPGDDAVAFIGKIGDVVPALVPKLVNAVIGREYPTFDKVVAPRGDIFSTSTSIQKGMSCELGLPLERTTEALDVCTDRKRVAAYAGVVAFRWVKGSSALLGFTKYPVTCALELPGAYAQHTAAYHQDVWKTLSARGIPHTLHWGQMNDFTPERVRQMYGPAVDRWIAARERLLSPEARRAFSSPFLRQTGLG